ncbi:MAG TPA: bifunctional diaminohydroxyphosphoribosylaminopyrimidine deaminase/5-amino-6-(5-phosphoribosylamino)uracil reductase RibD [Candidatus Babeliales bacterium]|nr:bifunctional diaminohydroxyphosphoribosylaminopyrimidine deaminase/5-amino-6-(5-phosphoribosylamino)uracil reductase RibD [Candidatus Babeliales bacterium]
METGNDRKLTPLDALYLQRAYELAGRAAGDTAPNPPAGAVVVRDGRIVGEGYHHRAGEPHAEPLALREAGPEARGATVYVSLEPCMHSGRTPPCTQALIEAGVARVVAGALDPAGHGGAALLRERGIETVVACDPIARDLIEIFAGSARRDRPYIALKMAMSLDGCVAGRRGVQERLGSEAEAGYVRELRIAYDAVLVGAGTVRIDDPQLTVRPAHGRLRPYTRVVACERESVDPRSRVFTGEEGYASTIVLAPAGLQKSFAALRAIADVLFVGGDASRVLDLPEAMKALRDRGIASVLCEGGPRLAAALIAANQADRFYWAVAPRLLGNPDAVPVLSGADLTAARLRFDRVERIGPDVVISGLLDTGDDV